MTTNAKFRLAARYGAPDATALDQWNQTLDQLLDHRSVRAFNDTPLPEGTLEALVAAAQSASTSSNLQVWSVVAVDEPKALAEYDERLGAFYQSEGMRASGWSEQVVNRLKSVANLHGREKLFEQLKQLGFGLR